MIRLLCVGLGGMGLSDRRQAEAANEFEITGGVDVNKDICGEFENETGKPAFKTLEEALKNTKSEAALIAAPDKFHAPLSITAMEAGLDVICEKPMAETLADAKKMVHTAIKKKKMLMVNHQLRWCPPYYKAAKLVDEGKVGQIQSLEFEMYVFSDACMKGYRAKLRQLMLQDLGIHHFDLIRYLTGKNALNICMDSWASNEQNVKIPATTNVYGLIRMENSIRVSYRSKMRAIADQTGYSGRAVITGSLGVLAIEKDNLLLQTYSNHHAGKEPETIIPEQAGPSAMKAYARSIKTRQPALTNGADNIKSLEILFAAIKSAETGKIIDINEQTG